MWLAAGLGSKLVVEMKRVRGDKGGRQAGVDGLKATSDYALVERGRREEKQIQTAYVGKKGNVKAPEIITTASNKELLEQLYYGIINYLLRPHQVTL